MQQWTSIPVRTKTTRGFKMSRGATNRRWNNICKAVKSQPMKSVEIEDMFGYKRRGSYHVLRTLEKQGRIEKRGLYWVSPDLLGESAPTKPDVQNQKAPAKTPGDVLDELVQEYRSSLANDLDGFLAWLKRR